MDEIKPYYVHISNRISELCEAISRKAETNDLNHNKIRLWLKEIALLNEVDRMLQYEEKQKVWTEDKNGQLKEMV